MSEYRNNNDGGYNDDLYMDAVDTKYTTISGGTPGGGDGGHGNKRRSPGKVILALVLAVCLVAGVSVASMSDYV